MVGGYTHVSESYLDNVEAVDVSTETPNCDSVANYPIPVGFPVGTILDGLPTVCGGYNPDTLLNTNECHQYLYEENRWASMSQSMLEVRYKHKSSMVDAATWLITGGKDNSNSDLDSTDVWQGGEFQPGPFLPLPLRNHCQVTLNSSYIAILGGYSNGENVLGFYLLDWKNEKWIYMPDVPVVLDNDPCGLIENSVNGFELVVLADYEKSYIFNFEDMTWREGPSIPYDVSVLYEEMPVQVEKTFYIMGGFLWDEDTVTDAILKFDNENYVWSLETARLGTARANGVAIPVPDEMVNCS